MWQTMQNSHLTHELKKPCSYNGVKSLVSLRGEELVLVLNADTKRECNTKICKITLISVNATSILMQVCAIRTE